MRSKILLVVALAAIAAAGFALDGVLDESRALTTGQEDQLLADAQPGNFTLLEFDVVSPANGAAIEPGQSVVLAATFLSDPQRFPLTAAFDIGGHGTVQAIPDNEFSASWVPPGPGSYEVVARVQVQAPPSDIPPAASGLEHQGFDNSETMDEVITLISAPVSFTVLDAPNLPPTVNFLLPEEGTVLQAPAQIIAQSDASDPDGSVVSVTYTSPDLDTRTSTLAPYEALWEAVGAGNYLLTATATDNSGATAQVTRSIVVSPPAGVTITSPADGAIINVPDDLVITAEGTHPSGIASLTFLVDGNEIGTATAAPYTAVLESPSAGTYSVAVRAVDGQGLTTTSITHEVVVNTRPTVTLTGPADGDSVQLPGQLVFGALASDADPGDSVVGVHFFVDGVDRASSTQSPYSGSWSPPGPGTYSVVAQAVDTRGQTGDSSTAIVTVTSAPPIANPVEPDPVSDTVGAIAAEFRVDESGGATYQIPLLAAPGTAGVTPSMALSYSSQGGDGPMGRGWSVSGTSSIARCRATPESGDDNGFPAIGFDAEDRFCLDGQRLLQLGSSSCATGVAGTSVVELRTEIESFQRVCAYRNNEVDGPRYFTVERRDGSISYYGDFDGQNVRHDAVLRRVPSSHSGPIYLWSQTRFQDSTGNYIDHVYNRDPAGIDYPNELVLSEVRYTGKRNLPGQSGTERAPYALLRFHYDTMSLLDRRQAYFAGTETWQTQRLARIESINQGDVLREYRTTYAASASGSRAQLMTSVEECVGAGVEALCLPPTLFDWAEDGSTFSTLESVASGGFENLISFRLGDIDGDGRLDLVWFSDQAGDGCTGRPLYVSYGQIDSTSGRQTFGPKQYSGVCSLRDSAYVDLGWQLLDYDGDGRDDVFVARSNGGTWELFLSQGSRSGGQAFDVTNDRLAAGSIAVGVNNSESFQPQFGDLDGDGVLDLVYPVGDDIVARLWETSAGSGGWGSQRTLEFEYDPGDSEACGVLGPCWIETAPKLSTQAGYVQLVDLDGDSRSDMLFESRQIVEYRLDVDGCIDPIAPPQSALGANPASSATSSIRALTPEIETALSSGLLECEGRDTTQYTTAYSVSHIGGATISLSPYRSWIVSSREEQMLPFPDAPIDNTFNNIRDFRFADVNGDGLTDVLIQNASGTEANYWRTEINTGTELVGLPSGGPGEITNFEQMQLLDIDGDGRADLVFPGTGVDAPFQVRYAQVDGSHGPAQPLPGGGALGCAGNCNVLENLYLFADLSGDGRVEFARIGLNGGQLDISRAPVAARFQPRDVITSIENGMGAVTLLDYAALNNRAVHRREQSSRSQSLDYGRGSPVQDLTGPMFVVARASSSSPGRVVSANSAGAPDFQHLSSLYYRYEAARMQAGGRGFLGFAAVSSIDPNHFGRYVVTRTEYSQQFPVLGMPERTQKVVSHGNYDIEVIPELGCIFDVVDDCFLGNAELDNFELAGRLLSDSTQPWEVYPTFVPGQQVPLQVRPLGTDELVYSYNDGMSVPQSGLVDAGVLTAVSTLFDHDAWGNVTLTEVATYEGGAAQPISSVATSNTYADDTARWRLGRLVESTVTHTRGTESVERHTRFAYDMGSHGTGMLVKEEVQPDGSADQWLKTLYDLDVYGNRVATFTCSGVLSDAACRSPLTDFNRDDGLVQRQVFQDFDERGRYPVVTRELFLEDGAGLSGGAGVEAVTQEVLHRDRYGHPLRVTDVNGMLSIAVHGLLGRPLFGWQQSVEGAQPGAAGEGVESFSLYRWCAGSAPAGQVSVACPAGGVFRSESISTGAPTRWIYHDVLGREILSTTETFNAAVTNKDIAAVCTVYDDRGRTSSVSEPFFLSGNATADGPSINASTCGVGGTYRSTTTVDLLDRPVLLEAPDGSQTSLSYDGLTTTTVDDRGNSRVDTSNALGELVLVEDANELEMHYGYDPVGNLATVTRDAGNGDVVTAMAYDALGRKIFMADPDAGQHTYTYNALGEQLAQIDSEGGRVEHDYDSRGRVWRTRSFVPGGAVEVTHSFEFDSVLNGLGQLSAAESSGLYAGYDAGTGREVDFRQEMAFDTLGRMTQATTWIDDAPYVTAAVYDGLGRAWKTQDASGEWRKTEFDERGFGVRTCASSAADTQPGCDATSSDTWLALLETDARGQPMRERRGGLAAMDVTRSYDFATGRLVRLCAGSTCQLMLDEYAWDTVGNLESRSRSNGSAHVYTEVFEHDALNRLTQARFISVMGITLDVVSASQVYDALGNICSKRIGGEDRAYYYGGPAGCGLDGTPGAGMGAAPFPPVGPGPGDLGRGMSPSQSSPHAVRHAAGTVGSSYDYDHRGNQTQRRNAWTGAVTREIYYSQQDQAYDIQGEGGGRNARVSYWYGPDGGRYKRQESGGKRTLYLGDVEIITEGFTTRTRRTLAGVFIEERINGTVTSERYLFHDHLGSLVRVSDVNGALLEGMDYGAFGERRGYVDPRNMPAVPQTTERGFTGHEHIDGLDVIHMNGRIYDDQLGRFLQPDPVVQSPGNTQNHNRYTYVLNNPLAYTDPSGYFFKKLWNNKWFRTALAIAITIWTGGMAAELGFTWAGAAWAAGGGFAAGVVGGGGLKSGLIGAFSGVAFLRIGTLAASQNWSTTRGVLAHAATGGVVSSLQGGNFGHGFVSAGLSKGVMRNIDTNHVVTDGILTSIAGGAISELTGGKFRNGAMTSAMQFAMNEMGKNIRRELANSMLDRAHEKMGELAQDGFKTHAEAQEAAANRWLGASIAARREVVWASVRLDDGSIGYTYPFVGPVGVDVIDPQPLALRVLADTRYRGFALGHTHFDSQLRFSGHDATAVRQMRGPYYLANSRGELRVLTCAHVGCGSRHNFREWEGSTLRGVTIKTSFP